METIKELQAQIDKLQRENSRLQDENASLWFLLDELEKSNVANPEHRELFEKTFNNLRKNAMMVHQKVESA
jgi:regulator of replication initiation timing